jgi:glutamate/tyrosine decarboxylase-like PLP-dependent enzyme
MANYVGFLAAREAAGADWRIREAGLHAEGAPRLSVYVSAETHTWIQKASDLFGLGTEAVRWVPTDDELRMDVDALARIVARDRAAGFRPMMVVGTAGSVMTGAVDPLPELAQLCREQGIWLHVDGAYGGFAAASPEAPEALRGLALADSVAVDPHKWLYSPLEAGCALVRRPEALRDAFAYHPPYYAFGVEAINFVDYGLQNSRGFRALKVWLALRQAGRAGYERLISQDILLARRLEREVEGHPELELIASGLSIVAFRYVPPELRARIGAEGTEAWLNELNEAVRDRMEREGEAFVSNAVVGGRYALRACIVNFNTTEAEITALPELAVRLGREIHAGRRSGSDAPGGA